MKMVKFLERAGVLLSVLALLVLGAAPSFAQVPSSNPPYNTDIGALITTTIGPAATGTQNSANQTNLDKTGVVCTFKQTASSGSASTTIAIQGFDAATQLWNTLITSSAISGPSATAPYAVAVKPGMAVGSLPSNYAAQSVPLPRVWRVQVITSGSANSITSVTGCNLIK